MLRHPDAVAEGAIVQTYGFTGETSGLGITQDTTQAHSDAPTSAPSMDLQGSAQDVGSGGREHGSSTSEASTEQPGPGRHSQAVVSAARGPPARFFLVAKTQTSRRRPRLMGRPSCLRGKSKFGLRLRDGVAIPRPRRDVVPVTVSARWRGDSTPSARRLSP